MVRVTTNRLTFFIRTDINGGDKICLRLRPFFDKGAFLRLEDIIGTMLHEVSG